MNKAKYPIFHQEYSQIIQPNITIARTGIKKVNVFCNADIAGLFSICLSFSESFTICSALSYDF